MDTSRPEIHSDRELAAWRGMLEAHSAIVAELDAELEREHGIALTAYEVLMFLGDAREGKLRMSELAERLLLSRSGMTRLVDRLGAGPVRARALRRRRPRLLRGDHARGRETLAATRPAHLAASAGGSWTASNRRDRCPGRDLGTPAGEHQKQGLDEAA